MYKPLGAGWQSWQTLVASSARQPCCCCCCCC